MENSEIKKIKVHTGAPCRCFMDYLYYKYKIDMIYVLRWWQEKQIKKEYKTWLGMGFCSESPEWTYLRQKLMVTASRSDMIRLEKYYADLNAKVQSSKPKIVLVGENKSSIDINDTRNDKEE